MRYQPHRWVTKRWETDCRYYVAELEQDFFGELQVKRSWGGRHSRRGNSMTIHADNYTHALHLLDEVAKRRKSRGYTRV